MTDKPSERIKPATLNGFRDILPKPALMKEDMLHTFRQVFRSFGFVPIETPHLEYTETLIGNGSDEIRKQLYRFRDNGDRDVTLRFDHTVPLARFVSQHRHELGMPFKRYAIGNVFRGESPQAGRYREFTQCDFDFIGTDSLAADAEIVQVIYSALRTLGIENFYIRLNSRKIMNGLAESIGLGVQAADLLRIIDKYDKIGGAKLITLLKDELKLDSTQSETVMRMIDGGSLSAVGLASATNRLPAHPSVQEGLSDLQYVCKVLDCAGIAPEFYCIDFSVARGLGYYTGIVYETVLTDLPDIGSVASGGRYDNLTASFSRDRMPGVGASIGLDRLLTAMEKLNSIQTHSASARVLIGNLEKAYIADSQKLAAYMRASGIAVEVYPDAEKMGKLFAYAERRGYTHMIAFGETEAVKEEYIVATLATGQKEKVSSRESLLEVLLNLPSDI